MVSPISSSSEPPRSFADVTPSDSTLLQGCQWLRVGVAGNLVLKGLNDSAGVTISVTANEYVPFGGGYIMAATTAGSIVVFI